MTTTDVQAVSAVRLALEEADNRGERVEALSRDFASDAGLAEDTSMEQLLQGPLADAMTHAGQLAMLRRLAGAPVARRHWVSHGQAACQDDIESLC